MNRRKSNVASPGKAGVAHRIKRAKSTKKTNVIAKLNEDIRTYGSVNKNPRKPLIDIENTSKEDMCDKENKITLEETTKVIDIKNEPKETESKNNKKTVVVESDAKENAEDENLCEYEKIRLRNIRQREALFAELAIQEAKLEATDVITGKRTAVKRTTKERNEATEPVRKSLRLAGGKVPEIKRFTYEQFDFLDKELISRKIRPEDFYFDDELISRNLAVEEREKMLEEMATKAKTFSGSTERPGGLKEVSRDSNSLVFKCGRGFYEFTKPEIISNRKEVVVVEKSSGAMFTGKDACRLIGAGSGMRIPPTIFETWQVFVQSTSYGRILVGGTDFLYEV